MNTISVISRKGGAGKTTVAVNLAVMAHLSGRAVLLVDIDPQRSAMMTWGRVAAPARAWRPSPQGTFIGRPWRPSERGAI